MTRMFFIVILNLLLCHFSVYGQTLNRSVLPARSAIQTISQSAELNSIDFLETKDKRIHLHSDQKEPLLDEAIKSIPKINDVKKIDSLIFQLAKGGDMSGGGTTLSKNNKRFFLDLYQENVSFDSTSCLVDSNVELLSKFNFEVSCLDQGIRQVLDRTQTLAPRLHASLIAIYKNIPFYLSSGKFRILDENFYLDPVKEFDTQMLISTSALYIKNLGIIISEPQFRELNEAHQTGLVIHEILRSMQIQFSLKLTNAEIQEIVASLFSNNKDRLFATLKKSGLSNFLANQFGKDPLFKEISSYYSQLKNLNQGLGVKGIQQVERQISLQTMDWHLDLSDILAQSSSDILKYRVQFKQKIARSDLVQLENLEVSFDRMVAQIRGQGVQGLYLQSLGNHAEVTGFLMNYNVSLPEDCAGSSNHKHSCLRLSQILKSLID